MRIDPKAPNPGSHIEPIYNRHDHALITIVWDLIIIHMH